MRYGYVNENYRAENMAYKSIILERTEFIGNHGFTAGAILFQSHIIKDKNIQAMILVNNCTIAENYGYDTIYSVRENIGNREYELHLEIDNVKLLNNKLLNQPSLNDHLIAYHHSPLISTIHFQGLQLVTLTDITIKGNELRGLSAIQVVSIRFQGVNNISDNVGTMGGGIHLDRAIILLYYPRSRLYLVNNTAVLSGGGIHVALRTLITSAKPTCFFGIMFDQCKQYHVPRNAIVLRDNSASVSGNSVYGGYIETCDIKECRVQESAQIFGEIFDIPWNASLSEVTSDAERLCFCVDGVPRCDLDMMEVSTYPGGLIRIPAVTVGQLNGTNPAIVVSRVTSLNASVPDGDARQQLGVTCQNLNYTIHTLEDVQVELTFDIVFGGVEVMSNRVIHVNATKCPQGFKLGNSLTCSCITLLKKNKVTCHLETQTFQRPANVWIGYFEATDEIFTHSACPLQKCKSEITTFSFNSTNSQCKTGFAGIICGSCAGNFSATFGGMTCKTCVDAYSALAVVIFVIAGPLLILAMLYGDLTIQKGTLNAIIFYANVVYTYRSIFFGPNHISVVTVIIAWLNLDLGVELCFYDGLDFYSRWWLQYLFPAYILLLSFILVCLNWYTTLGGKIIGNDIVSVLCTVILLCYTKLLRVVAEALSFTTISSGFATRKVWLYDGNITYMKGKHTPLSVIALTTLVFLILPFTILMIFEYFLLRNRTQRMLVKFNLHTLIVTYQKPYKKLYRWWTGFLLLVRVLVISLHQINHLGHQDLSLAIIVTLGLCLLGAVWNMGSLYHNKYITMIEAFYLTNLVMVAGWSEYVSTHHSQLILSYILVTLALLVFIAIILYHVITKIFVTAMTIKEKKKESLLEMTKDTCGDDRTNAPSSTYVEVTGDRTPLTQN